MSTIQVYRTRAGISHILRKIKKTLKKIYGKKLVDVYLFGSFARDVATTDSDIDIAVILKGSVNKIQEINKLQDALYDIMLESGELISVLPISEEEKTRSIWPLYHHIHTEGIKI